MVRNKPVWVFWRLATAAAVLAIGGGAAAPEPPPAIGSRFPNLVILAAVLCIVAIIILAVPAISDYLRRWRDNRRMLDEMHAMDKSRFDRAKDAIKAEDTHSDVLGWESEERTQGPTEPVAPRGPKLKGKTILIADDDPVVVMALSRHLQRLGYQVFRSPDATHALLGAIKMKPDLLILDINMPAGNGLAVCEMVVSDPNSAGLPVIIHSVIADDATKERCRVLGAHYIEKSPRSWEQIKILLDRLLDGKENGEEEEEPAPSKQAKAPRAVVAPPEGEEKSQDTREKAEEKVEKVEAGASEAEISQESRETQEKAEPASAGTAKAGVSTPESEVPPTPMLPVCGRPRLLCVESPPNHLEHVDHQLTALGLDILRTADFEEGFWTCFTEKPHAIIIQSPGKQKQLLGFLDRLKQHPVTRAIPVLLINEDGPELAARLPGDGNVKVLQYPMDWENLLSELESFFPVFQREHWDPFKAAAAADEEPPVSESEPAAFGGEDGESQHKPTILCIDDDPVVARSVAIRMKPYGISVISAVNGTQGFLMAVAKAPDLILLDLKMPEGDGAYIMNKLRDNPHTQGIPVIILTVTTHAGVKRQLIAAGAEAFLNKPLRWPELFEAIGRCIALPKQLLIDYKLPVNDMQLVEH